MLLKHIIEYWHKDILALTDTIIHYYGPICNTISLNDKINLILPYLTELVYQTPDPTLSEPHFVVPNPTMCCLFIFDDNKNFFNNLQNKFWVKDI